MHKSITIATAATFFLGLICSIWLSVGVSEAHPLSKSDHSSHHEMSMDVSSKHEQSDTPEDHCKVKCQVEINLTSNVELKKLSPARQLLFVSTYVYLTSFYQEPSKTGPDIGRLNRSRHSASQPVFAATNRFRI